jgi:cyanophycinase
MVDARTSGSDPEPGTLALVGGGEWDAGVTVDRQLLEASGTDEVVVLPTAAAYGHPDRDVAAATGHFEALGARVRGLMALTRRDACEEDNARVVREARFLYLGDGSPLHLRSVLKSSPLWEALARAWSDGAVVSGSGAGAMVLTDPMVDPRGGAFTLGLGLLKGLAVIPHHGEESAERLHRTLALAASGLAVVGVPEHTALVRRPGGTWSVVGPGEVEVYMDRKRVGLDGLPA